MSTKALKEIKLLSYLDECWMKWNRHDIACYTILVKTYSIQSILHIASRCFDWWNSIRISGFPSKVSHNCLQNFRVHDGTFQFVQFESNESKRYEKNDLNSLHSMAKGNGHSNRTPNPSGPFICSNQFNLVFGHRMHFE